MPARLSRRKLAIHAAERLLASDESVLDELAAMLVAERREREGDLLTRDIEDELARRGMVVARVESAVKLGEAELDMVKQVVSSDASTAAPTVYLRESINADLIGGVRITTPTQMLDGTIAKKLSDLRAKKL